MTLRDLVNHLGGSEIDFGEERRTIKEKIILPSGSVNTGVSLTPFREMKGSHELYVHFEIEDKGLVLDSILQHAKSIGSEEMEIQAGFSWTPEGLQNESKLPFNLYFDRLTIKSDFYYSEELSGEITFQTNGRETILFPKGEYRNHLNELLEVMKPTHAKIFLSDEDRSKLAKSLRPEEKYVTVRSYQVSIFEKELGKSLTQASEGESRIVEFSRKYGPIELLKGRRLEGMQEMARVIENIDLGEKPILTDEGIKQIIQKEILWIDEFMDTSITNTKYTHLEKLQVVKKIRRMAQEHFGSDILIGIDNSKSEYIGQLPNRYEVEEPPVSLLGHQFLREYYLFQLFKDSYTDNPQAVEAFRQFYQREPELTITSKQRFSRNTQQVIKPSQASVYALEIQEREGALRTDRLEVKRYNEGVRISLNLSLERPSILDLQETICEKAGVRFNLP